MLFELLIASLVYVMLTSGVSAIDRMSDPATDAQNMDDPQNDPSIIPSHLVMLEDPASYDQTPGLPLDPNDFSQGEQLIDPEIAFDDSLSDPILLANLFQGDIRITSNDELFSLTAHASHDKETVYPRNAIIDEEKKWVDGLIPYEISSSYDASERAVIAKAFADIHQRTCIKFKARQGENDYIHITKGNGCSSSVGRAGGKQTVSLGAGCVYFGIVIHELMHAIGFWHEQSRGDRNDFVDIIWSNIQGGMEYNFQKYDWNIIQHLGVGYDTGSIMHYGENAFAIDRRRPTIISKDGSKIGQRNHFSQSDTTKINKLYKCSATGTTGPAVTKPPPIPLPDKCVDSNPYCAHWAGAGECTTNGDWMHPNCKKSCNQCGVCNDNNEWCSDWSRRGECTKSRDYMEIHCRKSCSLCNGGVGGSVTCVDENKYCKAWADSGECKANPSYMKKHCKLSCKTC